eukprot:CAMPEP_0113327030 /NCGR_PEP_ID=MMETSP0010_2-20120614/18985_1 /TAXON_ID=216773 ORGANISM="Corethron hystrix, Strain 308" /NCGR_SAMPLE_ID=MMETSP0010_2 /ASSEMBLY_ACC=CAM_ASM_000155 /LENGTH=622 /DNA_ID=CAMNT_0000187697 /DNA_START=821 /DNA_END=2689 /DNA_ORIENTATION=- /assembly_acc=CAM_ASM_000155
MSQNSNSNKDALEILKKEGNWFRMHCTDDSIEANYERREENTTRKEINPNLVGGIHEINKKSNTVITIDPIKGFQELQFDHIFDDDSTEEHVYSASTAMLVCDFINGYNATCLVYGQTGSGKSHTMFGNIYNNRWESGIVPQACKDVLGALHYRKHNLNYKIESSVTISYIQIFGNEVTDLLNKGHQCGKNRAAAQRFVLDGAAEIEMKSLRDLKGLLSEGELYKKKAATIMNAKSSRAHTLVVLTLRQKRIETSLTITSKLFMVDLGGSENTKKSRIEAGKSSYLEELKRKNISNRIKQNIKDAEYTEELHTERVGVGKTTAIPVNFSHYIYDDTIRVTNEVDSDAPPNVNSIGFVKSDRMREAININLGLFALKRCVEALKSDLPFVPYASSKLTAMLSTGLGGNSKTTVIICASKEITNMPETLAALKFGQSCRRIIKEAKTGSNLLEETLQKIDAEIKECEALIVLKEKWEVREEERHDDLAEKGTMEADGFGGKEVRKITTLVGAEQERNILGRLLAHRAELAGTHFESMVGGSKYGGDIGFGDANRYLFGKRYRADIDNEVPARFSEKVSVDDLPSSTHLGDSKVGWNKTNGVNGTYDKNALNKRKHKLAYVGISA